MDQKSDIIYQDDDVAILHPKSNEGIPIWTNYKQPKNTPNILTTGLKTGEQLQKEGIEFGRAIYHPYTFFRAPYRNPENVDKKTQIHEVVSYYDKDFMKYSKNKIFIRVDPDQTYVYSSEIRVYMASAAYHSTKYNNELKKSRKTLPEYLNILSDNENRINHKEKGTSPIYNLYTSRIESFISSSILYPSHMDSFHINDSYNSNNYPRNNVPVNRTSEILVRLPNLTPDYFAMAI